MFSFFFCNAAAKAAMSLIYFHISLFSRRKYRFCQRHLDELTQHFFASRSISPQVPVQAGGAVVTTGSVQQAVQDGDTQAAAPCSHGNLGLPGVRDGVVGLNCCKVRGAVVPESMGKKESSVSKHIFASA